MGLWSAVALAVGTMVGASIFSIFGVGAQVAGHNLPVVFVISGAVALLVAYSYARLGRKIVSGAGPMEFILRGFGDGLVTGSLSFLNWLTYVISIALFAKGFAGYAAPLTGLGSAGSVTAGIEIGVILLFTALGLLGSGAVGRAEVLIVLIKLGILGVFVVLGLGSVNPTWLEPRFSGAAASATLHATAIFFLSYMGFGLVTNASEHMRHPERDVPRAIYVSIGVVTVVYVLVSVVAIGNLPLPALIGARENALAEAARPFLGKAGFLLVSVGALFSIASALNATLFGGANVAFALARDGELPAFFERKLWFGGTAGLYLTAGTALLFTVVFRLEGIASITSSVFMIIYLFVMAAHWRLCRTYGGSRIVIGAGLAIVGLVFVLLLAYQWLTDRSSFYGVWGVLLGTLLVEWFYRRRTGRRLTERSVPVRQRV